MVLTEDGVGGELSSVYCPLSVQRLGLKEGTGFGGISEV